MKMKILFCKDFWPPCGKKKNKKVGGVHGIVVDAFFHDRKLYPLFIVVSSFVKDQIGAGAKLLFIPQSKVT